MRSVSVSVSYTVRNENAAFEAIGVLDTITARVQR